MDSLSNVKISVIIPIYNHGDYVLECLRSVVNQRDVCFEIVAIDDGSSDNSYGLALEYLGESLVTTNWKLTKRENRGINKTINEAIQNSSGEIIYLLASDDRMPDGSLAKIRQTYLNETERCKLFFYDIALISWQGELVNQSAASVRRGGASLLGYSKMYLATQIVLSWGSPFANQFYPRDYYERYGPYPEDLKYEDLYFALNAISVDRFIFVPFVLKEYRLRKNQTHTPGLTLADLDQTNVLVRNRFKKSIKLRYSLVLFVGSLYFNVDKNVFKYLLGKIGSLIQRSAYWWALFRIESTSK